MDKSESIIVFTHRSLGTLLKFKGSTSWKLNPARAGKCKYIICCQNTESHLYREELVSWKERSDSNADETANYPHPDLPSDVIDHPKTKGEAFFIGKISEIVPSLNPNDEGRWMIEFSEFATISIKDFWKGYKDFWKGYRNPVLYADTDKIIERIDKEGIELNFSPAHKRDTTYMGEYFHKENEFWENWKKSRSESLLFKKEVDALYDRTSVSKKEREAGLKEINKKYLDKAPPSTILPESLPRENPFIPTKNGMRPLTIGEAKQGLSKKYDIPIDNIEIILKG